MNNNLEIWTRKESKRIADCRVFIVREDFCERASDRLNGTFFVLENPDWVNVIALTENAEVVLIEQFRHGAEEITLEIPGGMIDKGEEPENAARRELAEETGYTSEKFVYLGKSKPNPALQNNWIFHFLALDCRKTVETGYTSEKFVYLGKSKPNPALQNNWIFHFLALDCRKTVETAFDEHESINVKLADLPEIEKLIRDEIITHSLVLAGIYRFEQYRKLQQTD